MLLVLPLRSLIMLTKEVILFSQESLEVFADLLGQVVLPVQDPDFEAKAAKLAKAKQELAEARIQLELDSTSS